MPELREFLSKGHGWIFDTCSERAGPARLENGTNDIAFVVFPTQPGHADFFHASRGEVLATLVDSAPDAHNSREKLKEVLPVDRVWVLVYLEDGVWVFSVPVANGPQHTQGTLN